YILFILLIIPLTLTGQNNKIDSLKSLLKKNIADTQQVNILNDISSSFFQINGDSAIYYGNKAKELAAANDFERGLAYANKNIGIAYYYQGDFKQVLSFWEESLKSFKEINDKDGVSNLINNIGAVYFAFGDDAVALDYYLKALQFAEEIEAESKELRIYSALVNIGTLYTNKEETYEKALIYFRKAIRYLDFIDDQQSIGNLYTNLGSLFMDLEQYDSSIYYLDKTLETYKDSNLYAQPLQTKGKLLVQKGNIQEGIKLQTQAVELSKEAGQKQLLAKALIGLGESYIIQGQNTKAISELKEAKEVSENLDLKYELKDIYQFLSRAYSNLNNYERAYYFNDLYAAMKDTVYNIETADKIRGLQFSYQIEKKQDEINLLEASNEIQQLQNKRQLAISWGAVIAGVLILLLAIGIFRRYKFMKQMKLVLEKEKDRSDNLLLNILPEETAEELKEKGFTEPKYYDSASILFTDFKGFTNISAKMTPNQLVSDLHECFKMFDIITSRYGLEKIKTIGDAYMAAGGLPKENSTHPDNVARAALEIRNYMDKHRAEREKEGRVFFEVRIGIHTGPVVAGVVGIKKFAYDIWGDTVNIAARMESTSEAGKVNISENTYQLIKDKFECEYRGEIEAKNTGKLRMYFLNNLKVGELEPVRDEKSKVNQEYVS
uniref:adenylate/guanylate cyclase domain-containing protein n=1 Tax=Marivirga sp. TaxID=2018662 RepID=UPI0025ED5DCA